jgi:glycosyltransferase involved in cell wall biosynthesis
MKNKPIISIVTPSFNQGKYIRDTIQSVLSQKGDFYIDYIIMDGNSTDDTVSILNQFETLLNKNCAVKTKYGLQFFTKKNQKFDLCNCQGVSYRWQSEKDRGQTHAINKGIQLMRGDLFAWINSDDYYAGPDIFQALINFFNNNPDCDMAYGRGYCVDENKKILRDYHDNCSSLAFDRNILKYECYILQPTVFVRRGVMDQIKFLDESLHWCMDWDLWLKISMSHAVKFIPVWIAHWRQYEGIKSLEGDYRYFKERYTIIRRYSSFKEYIVNKWHNYMLYPGHLKFHIWLKYKPAKIAMGFFYGFALMFNCLLKISVKLLRKQSTLKSSATRLAIFSPLEPLQSGVATFFTKLLKALAKEKPDLFIDIFIDDGYTPIDFQLPRVRILNHDFFAMNSMYYDTIFYQMGNNYEFHGYLIPYLIKYPGIVEMHDIKIQGVYARIIDSLKEYVLRFNIIQIIRNAVLYPELIFFIIAKIFKSGVRKETWLDRCLYGKSFALRKSKEIIIRDTSLLARFGLSKKKCHIIIHGMDIKPLPDDGEKARIRRRLNIKKNEFVIVTAGIIHNSKRIDKVLEALGKIKNKIPGFLYVLAGESIWEGCTIEELILSNGLKGQVRVTGWIPNEDWLDYITIADIGINLRGNSSGEQSGPLSNFIERGKVVLISDYDQYRIYPDEFAIKIKLDATEIDSMARAIERAYGGRPHLARAGARARKYAEEELNFDKKIIRQYIKVLGFK